MAKEMIRKNISVREAACPHCGELPNDRLLDRLQALRDACGFPLKFTSIYRCPVYNKLIGGHPNSAHQLGVQDNDYGAADIGIHKRYAKKRFKIIFNAYALGFYSFEFCNLHVHIGSVSHDHPMHAALYYGISK